MTNDRYDRQSFLGADSEEIFSRTKVGVVGLGGGGSHIVQQLSHIGFRDFVVYDPDVVEDSNLNRLVGATENDVKAKTAKVVVAKRIISGLQGNAQVRIFQDKWQNQPEPLRNCNIIFGCVDGFGARHEIEVCSRRYLIPYIDIGMDVHKVGKEPPRVAGQVILSMPGGPCMWCLGFLTEDLIAQEVSRYGDAGPRPQVVWSNGILASTAVGVAVDLLTDWTTSLRQVVYLSYDGNKNTLEAHVRLKYLGGKPCNHYTTGDIGDPIL